MKIVIAEDDAVTRKVLQKTLEALNFEVTPLADGQSAWDRLLSDDARLLITDWKMPGLDGLDLCRKIRLQMAGGPYVYIILLTARSSREDRLRGLQAGADDLLSKPLDRAELFARLQVARRIIGMEEQLRSRSAELERMHDELERRNVLLAEIASTDGLTGLKNHRFFQESLESQFQQSKRRGLPFSVVMLDVDQFKSYNDRFGHPAGDEVLREVAQLLRASVREQDVVARYGGEEFSILLPGAGMEASRDLGERVRRTIEGHSWEHRPITISLGIATMDNGFSRAANLLDLADRALYRSKSGGRNRVTHSWNLPPNSVDRRVVVPCEELEFRPPVEPGLEVEGIVRELSRSAI